MTKYLVVSATQAEARYVPEGLEVVVTGVGKTAAATVTAQALARRETDPLVVVNIGSAGALREGLSGIYTPGTVINHDMNAELVRSLGLDPAETIGVPGGDGTVLASGDTFVADPVLRGRLAERAHLVDMEGYGVAYACRHFGVPVKLVKHVSDAADESALDWPALVDASAAALGEWLADLLAGRPSPEPGRA
jgi:adenosylhomocysteine nucleosidase